MSKKIYVRLGVSDIIMTKEEHDKLNISKYAVVDGYGEVEVYFVEYEDEDGDVVDEDGNKL